MQRGKTCGKWIFWAAAFAVLFCCSQFLLGKDFQMFLAWYAATLFLAFGSFPLVRVVFRSFPDGGWAFSRAFGLAIAGWLNWVLVVVGVLKFSRGCVFLVSLILFGVIWIGCKKNTRSVRKNQLSVLQILGEEMLFLLIFLLWAYFCGFRPEAYGTEKFMDYGFLASMVRSEELPPADIWYGLEPVNYYYGGQYFAAFLCRISSVGPEYGYNLMRAMIPAVCFCMPFSLVRKMLQDSFGQRPSVKASAAACIGGILAGAAVSIAGNMHYVLYGLLGKVFRLPGYDTYWFPDSTRYIGYNPDVPDKCIHEFPAYSFVLGDLHAHMINLIFVLLFLGVLYTWISEQKMHALQAGKISGGMCIVKRSCGIRRHWRFLSAAFFAGLFPWTNYWDYIIYMTVLLLAVIFFSLRRREGTVCRRFLHALLLFLSALVIGIFTSLPFTLTFIAPVSGIAVARMHTPLYQLAVLWGLPAAVLLLFFLTCTGKMRKKEKRGKGLIAFLQRTSISDLSVLLFGFSAAGLILIPEFLYVVDIYGSAYARANTMFKLTYQAFVLFGMMMGYALPRIFCTGGKILRIISAFLGFLLILTFGYTGYAISCWFGNVLDRSGYIGLDATAFLEQQYPDDAPLIRWMQENIDGQPLVLEAPGDSYTEFDRVSAMTGIPTLEGWYVHEWLWRNDTEDLNRKAADIERIYTTEDEEERKELAEKYGIDYIFVGSCEREKYGEKLNETGISALGKVIRRSGQSYLVRVENQ